MLVRKSSEMSLTDVKQVIVVLILLLCLVATILGIEYARYQIYDIQGSNFLEFMWLDLIYH